MGNQADPRQPSLWSFEYGEACGSSGQPQRATHPYFAMAVPRSRESYVERLSIEGDLVGLVGRRCASWIKSRADRDGIELIKTRNYVPPQTAFYATWLVFGDEAVGAEFLDTYPQHQLGGRIAMIEADHQALAAKLQNRLQRGDFNLGRIGDERQRENLALKYVEAAEALRGFSSQLELLERARRFAPQWQER